MDVSGRGQVGGPARRRPPRRAPGYSAVSGVQSALIASGGVGGLAVLVLYVLRPWAQPRHAAPRERLETVPPVLRNTVPWPARVTGCACGVQSGEHKLWCATADAALDWAACNELPPPGEWTDQLLADLQAPGQRPRGMAEPPTLNDLRPGAGYLSPVTTATCPSDPGQPLKVDSPAPGPGAGDESEGYGLTAPPAPGLYGIATGEPVRIVVENCSFAPARRASATEVANAQADAFMAAMRADHAAWMASARARWAAHEPDPDLYGDRRNRQQQGGRV